MAGLPWAGDFVPAAPPYALTRGAPMTPAPFARARIDAPAISGYERASG